MKCLLLSFTLLCALLSTGCNKGNATLNKQNVIELEIATVFGPRLVSNYVDGKSIHFISIEVVFVAFFNPTEVSTSYIKTTLQEEKFEFAGSSFFSIQDENRFQIPSIDSSITTEAVPYKRGTTPGLPHLMFQTLWVQEFDKNQTSIGFSITLYLENDAVVPFQKIYIEMLGNSILDFSSNASINGLPVRTQFRNNSPYFVIPDNEFERHLPHALMGKQEFNRRRNKYLNNLSGD